MPVVSYRASMWEYTLAALVSKGRWCKFFSCVQTNYPLCSAFLYMATLTNAPVYLLECIHALPNCIAETSHMAILNVWHNLTSTISIK